MNKIMDPVPTTDLEKAVYSAVNPILTRGKYILDENGEPIPSADLLEWGKWLEDVKNTGIRIVKKTYFGDGERDTYVSTVFLGIDHGWNCHEDPLPAGYKPILWETMVFGGQMDGFIDRYTTRQKALKGHKRVCKKVKLTLGV